MKESYKEFNQSTISLNNIPRRITRQQTQSARRMTSITRSQSRMHMTSLRHFYDTSRSFTRFVGPLRCRLTEIIKPNDPRANCSKMIESKHAEIRDLDKRGTFRAFLRTELPYWANLYESKICPCDKVRRR